MHTDVENTGNFKPTAFRQGTKGRRLALGRGQSNHVTGFQPHLESHRLADQHAARIPESGDFRLLKRIPQRFSHRQIGPADTTHDSAKIDRVGSDHRLPLDLRCHRNHRWQFGQGQCQPVKILNAA